MLSAYGCEIYANTNAEHNHTFYFMPYLYIKVRMKRYNYNQRCNLGLLCRCMVTGLALIGLNP